MTEPKTEPDDDLRDEAKRIVEAPPDKVPGAEGLPDDVRDGKVEDE